MTDDGKTETETRLTQQIDLLMDSPPAERPTIFVVGDESVSSITLPAKPRARKG